MDRQLLHQKDCQIISVIKTNTFIVFKTKPELRCQNELKTRNDCFYYWDYLTNFWCTNWRTINDVVERLCLCVMVFWTQKLSWFFNLQFKLHMCSIISCKDPEPRNVARFKLTFKNFFLARTKATFIATKIKRWARRGR